MKYLFSALLVFAALSMAVVNTSVEVHADDYSKAKAANAKKLKSKKALERAEAIESICETGDKRAGVLAVMTMMKEKNAFAGQRMGNALRHITDEEAAQAVAKRVNGLKGLKNAFTGLWAMTGLLAGETDAGTKLVVDAVNAEKTKKPYFRTAALEAIAVSGRVDLWKPVVNVLTRVEKDWEKNPLPLITACTVASRIDIEESGYELVTALAATMANYEEVRIKRFAAAACASISNSKPYMSPRYWRQWAKTKGKVGEEVKTASGRVSDTSVRRKQPQFFGVEAVGNRIVFVIDHSGSMAGLVTVPPTVKKPKKPAKKGPITGKGRKKKDDKDKEKEIPAPDYSKVKNKLDLAKVELIHTLTYLDKDFEFQVVVYDDKHKYLIQNTKGFVKASDSNKKRFIKGIRQLQVAGATNIHGSLLRAFKTTTKEPVKGDPALAPEAFKNGAETIFFLTDGFACFCDANQGTEGPFATGEKLLPDIVRVNTFRKVVINTIGIGPHDDKLLPALAKSSGGAYRAVGIQ